MIWIFLPSKFFNDEDGNIIGIEIKYVPKEVEKKGFARR